MKPYLFACSLLVPALLSACGSSNDKPPPAADASTDGASSDGGADGSTPADGSGDGGPRSLTLLGSLAFKAPMFDFSIAVGPAKVFVADLAGSIHVVDVASRADTASVVFEPSQATASSILAVDFVSAQVVACYGTEGFAAPYAASGLGAAAQVTAFANCSSFAAIPGGSTLAVGTDGVTPTVLVLDAASAFANVATVTLASAPGPIGAASTTVAAPTSSTGQALDQITLVSVANKTSSKPIAVPAGTTFATADTLVTHDGSVVFFAQGHDIDVVNVATGKLGTAITSTIPLWTVGGIALTPDGAYLVASGAANASSTSYAVVAVRLSDRTVTSSQALPAGFVPNQTKVAADGTVLVLGNVPVDGGGQVDTLQFLSLQ